MNSNLYKILLVAAIAIALWKYVIWPVSNYIYLPEHLEIQVINFLLHIFELSFLYYFVKVRKQEQISLFAVLMVLVCSTVIFALPIISMHYALFDASMAQEDIMRRQYYYYSIPGFFIFIFMFFIAVQLYRNRVEGSIRKSLQWVGVCIVVSMLLKIFLAPAILAYLPSYYAIWLMISLGIKVTIGISFMITYALEWKQYEQEEPHVR